MKTYLVTGGAGFIGSNFVKYILNKYRNNIKIIILDKLTYAGNLQNLHDEMDDIVFIKGDICDGKLVNEIFEDYDIDYVVNFAAESHVDRSIENPMVFLETNILGTQTLLEVSKKHWEFKDEKYISGVRYLQVSTDEVYGSLGDIGYFTEDTPINPRSPYSASKASADLIVQSYIETYKYPAIITRCSNNYGAYQFHEKLIPLTIEKVLNGDKIPLYGDGKNVRDWLYVKDHCKAIDVALHNGKLGEIYNIGGHNEKPNIEIIKIIIDIIKELTGKNYDYDLINYVNDRKGHDRRYAIDPTKIKNELGWYPETKFEDGIFETIKWYLDNTNWINNITWENGEIEYGKLQIAQI